MRATGWTVALLSARRWNEGGRTVPLGEAEPWVRGVRTAGRHPALFVYDPVPIWRALGAAPDLLDIHEEPFALATAEILLLRRLRRSRVPYVLYSAQNIRKRYPWPFRMFERAALRGAAGAYVCNAEAGEILRSKGLRGPAAVIGLGVDVQAFHPDQRVPDPAAPVVGYIGRLESHKGVSVLLEAAARHPWRVRITGDGPERAALEGQASALGIGRRVVFLGHASGDELAARYRELDVLAVPSIPTGSWTEQFGRVAVEAMASGVPVVASDAGALPDVVGGAGILVPPSDPAALRNGILAALEPTRRAELRAAGVERARGYTWAQVASEQSQLYRRALGEDRRDPQVVVVAYGSPDLLVGAVDGLGGRFALTIVDNSSSIRTRELAAHWGAEYIDPGRNLGFGAAVNLALRSLADRDLADRDVLLLNPDARLGPEAVAAMVEALRGDPAVAAVGATQTEPGSGRAVRVWWPFPTPARAWREALGLGGLTRAKDFAIGSVLLLRSEAVADVGGFDERFFLYAEEMDWQKRARHRGWRIAVAEAAATHIGGGTSEDPGRREELFYASIEQFVRKHSGGTGWRRFRAAMLTGASVRQVVLRGEARDAARRRLAILRRSTA